MENNHLEGCTPLTDYVAIVLNGLFTGIGVILAHEFWDWFKEYRKRIEVDVKNRLNELKEDD